MFNVRNKLIFVVISIVLSFFIFFSTSNKKMELAPKESNFLNSSSISGKRSPAEYDATLFMQ